MTATETGREIYAAIASIMRQVPAIGKDRKNVQQGYNYRGIDDCYNAIQPLLAEHGVFVCPEVLETTATERQSNRGGALFHISLRVKHTFYAKDGSSVTVTTVGEGMDSGDKAANKAMSAAMKYALIGIFSIPVAGAEDSETDDHDVKPSQRPQAAPQPRQQREPESQSPSRQPPRAAQSGEVLTVENVKVGKEGKRANGDPWTRWDITADGLEFSTFSETDADIAEKNIGKPCRLDWEIGKYGNKLTHIEPAAADAQAAHQPAQPAAGPAVGSTGETPRCRVVEFDKKEVEGRTGKYFTAYYIVVDAPDYRGERFATTNTRIAKELEDAKSNGMETILFWHQTANGKIVDDATFFEADTTTPEYAANPPEDDIPF